MSKCRYDLSEECHSKRDCLICVLDKIKTEISTQSRMHMDGDLYVKVSECVQIIDKHKPERGE